MPSATLRSMPKRSPRAPTASSLTVCERMPLFCVASRTDWQRAGVPEETVTRTTTERKAQKTSIKWALFRLSAERGIPPVMTTGKARCLTLANCLIHCQAKHSLAKVSGAAAKRIVPSLSHCGKMAYVLQLRSHEQRPAMKRKAPIRSQSISVESRRGASHFRLSEGSNCLHTGRTRGFCFLHS
jgi:hypothetical protein